MKRLVAFVALSTGALAAATKLEPLAGTGQRGFSGDGGPAVAAQIHHPFGLVRGPDHALYFCDTGNHAVRRIDPRGVITTVAGTGRAGYSGDGGPARSAQVNEPYEVRFDGAGNLVFVERLNHCIRKIDMKTGVISTIAGTGKPGFAGDGGPAVRAQFSEPHSIQFDRAGNLFVCDIRNHRLRRIDAKSAAIATFSGTGERKNPPDGAPISGSPLFGPRAVDFSADGSLWLALREGNAVYRLDPAAGVIRHVITTDLHGPKGVALSPDGRVYLADTEAHRIVFIDPNGARPSLNVLVGDGKKGVLAHPHGVFVDSDGSVLIGDTENNCIWRVVPPAK
jgi:streptogramin lyase